MNQFRPSVGGLRRTLAGGLGRSTSLSRSICITRQILTGQDQLLNKRLNHTRRVHTVITGDQLSETGSEKTSPMVKIGENFKPPPGPPSLEPSLPSDYAPNKSMEKASTTIANEKDPLADIEPENIILTLAELESELANETPEDVTKYYDYVDTYNIFVRLKTAGFSDTQSDIIVLSIRELLARRLHKCKEVYYPLGEAQNEAYLFEATCSELRSEIQASRLQQITKGRLDLATIERNSEMLHQDILEQLVALKNDVDMDVNERKNVNNEHQNKLALLIQALNNRIKTDIDSDFKKELEGLRWHIMRRGLLSIIVVCLSIVFTMGLSKRAGEETKRQEIERQKEEERELERQEEIKREHSRVIEREQERIREETRQKEREEEAKREETRQKEREQEKKQEEIRAKERDEERKRAEKRARDEEREKKREREREKEREKERQERDRERKEREEERRERMERDRELEIERKREREREREK
ncbi:hypothetical protein NADFUDRAFT_81689 [Nadsonia fulvescens var. elongata DSM 6958]|uniref:Uncharacterized protein n=1 Tax=Nadsonia fulvescens var. elongata DSM 6958 TaxID=857566 RepID=A0A1E3PNS7_9ASCO|nr:hypothetical protein NADFUDRAFT_81689 [Nadsonia fulvescens var. elongata DSM 6958]